MEIVLWLAAAVLLVVVLAVVIARRGGTMSGSDTADLSKGLAESSAARKGSGGFGSLGG